MDILEQKRRVITTAIIAVVLTGIVIAAIVATPLINQLHSQASRSAGNVADAKTQNIQVILDQHQDLARQTASERLTGDKQPRTFKLTDPDGASVLAFMRPLGDYNWEVHMNSQVSEVYAQVTNDIRRSL